MQYGPLRFLRCVCFSGMLIGWIWYDIPAFWPARFILGALCAACAVTIALDYVSYVIFKEHHHG